MKSLQIILCLFIVIPRIYSQSLKQQSEPLKVEWNLELKVAKTGAQLTEMTIGGGRLYYALRGQDGSAVFAQDLNDAVPEPLIENSFVQNLIFQKDKLYSIGGCQLIRRDAMAAPESEICLKLQENWNLSAVEGQVAGTTVYGLHWANMLAAYDLNGNLKWSKEISELTQNQFLQYGGGYLYIYSQINKPDVGFHLMQYDTLGNQKWSVGMGLVNNILSDQEGNCYAFIVQSQTSNLVNKYSPAGTLIWSKVVPGQVVLNGYSHGDSLFVCGSESIDATPGRHQNPAFSILSVKDGKVLHQQVLDFYSGEEGNGEGFSQVAFNGTALYLGGHTGTQYVKNFLVKLSREGNTTGIKEDKTTNRMGFTIFPNPGASRFTIACVEGATGTLKVTVRNSVGQVVQKKEIACDGKKSWELDLNKQPAGHYSVEIQAGGDRTVRKIILE